MSASVKVTLGLSLLVFIVQQYVGGPNENGVTKFRARFHGNQFGWRSFGKPLLERKRAPGFVPRLMVSGNDITSEKARAARLSLDEDMATSATCMLEVEYVVRGYHEYMRYWTPEIGEVLSAEIEASNAHDM